MEQLITPNPNIPAEQGMCLQYVRQAFGRPAVSPRAIDAWNKSTSKHYDTNFPDGCWVPLWFSIATVPAGHVVLRAPDNTVWSTSDNNPSPVHHHSSLNDLMAYYAYYGLPLTYLGWTEDIDGFTVVQLNNQTQEDLTMAKLDNDDRLFIQELVNGAIRQIWGTAQVTQELIQGKTVPGNVDVDAIVKQINDDAARRMAQ